MICGLDPCTAREDTAIGNSDQANDGGFDSVHAGGHSILE